MNNIYQKSLFNLNDELIFEVKIKFFKKFVFRSDVSQVITIIINIQALKEQLISICLIKPQKRFFTDYRHILTNVFGRCLG